MIEITCFVVGMIATNCYLIEDSSTGALAVVDPGDVCAELYEEIDRHGGKLEYILLTHGHYDHILGAAELCRRYHPTVCAADKERELIEQPALNLSANHGIHIEPFTVDRYLLDGDIVKLGESDIMFINTPGHTAGSGCYIVDGCIFSGDTLFCMSVGRTDFPTSSMSDMMKSAARLRDLDGDYNVYPGHEMFTTLSRERRFNPYMR